MKDNGNPVPSLDNNDLDILLDLVLGRTYPTEYNPYNMLELSKKLRSLQNGRETDKEQPKEKTFYVKYQTTTYHTLKGCMNYPHLIHWRKLRIPESLVKRFGSLVMAAEWLSGNLVLDIKKIEEF